MTICTNNREYLFGEITDGVMRLNQLGEIVRDAWLQTATIRPNVVLDEFIVMPNHLHGIIVIEKQSNHFHRGVLQYAPTTATGKLRSPSQTIGAIIRGFKSFVTVKINQIDNSFGRKIWQRNFYEHIIRQEDDLNKIREYIVNNPLKWGHDRNNKENILM